MGDLVALVVWVLIARVIWLEYRGDAQARRDAASMRSWERAREVLR